MTVELTPAVLAALAEGVTRLEKGDENMCAQGRAVRRTMAASGQILSRFQWIPAADASVGFIRPGLYAASARGGSWNVEGKEDLQDLKGDILYFDRECTILLRVL